MMNLALKNITKVSFTGYYIKNIARKNITKTFFGFGMKNLAWKYITKTCFGFSMEKYNIIYCCIYYERKISTEKYNKNFLGILHGRI